MVSGGFDVVIAGGRVIDPETRLDAVRHVGINGGRIAAVSETPLSGRTQIDASGLVVAPGYIDLHSHTQTIPGDRIQAYDGVTTVLELESGIAPIGLWYDNQAATGRAVNYGASVAAVDFPRYADMHLAGRLPIDRTIEIAVANFTPTATLIQEAGSIERWARSDARGTGNYTFGNGVHWQVFSDVTGTRTSLLEPVRRDGADALGVANELPQERKAHARSSPPMEGGDATTPARRSPHRGCTALRPAGNPTARPWRGAGQGR